MGLFDIFGGGDPSEAANPYLNRIGTETSKYYDPYIQRGQSAFDQLQPEYGRLMQDPSAVMNRIGAGYKQSPGFQFSLDQALKAGNQSAAAGGMIGSPESQQNAMQTATGLGSQDYYNYLNNAMGLYGQGLGGLGNIGQMGYGASDAMARMKAQQLSAQAQNAFAGQANQNQFIGGMLGGIGSFALGGPGGLGAYMLGQGGNQGGGQSNGPKWGWGT